MDGPPSTFNVAPQLRFLNRRARAYYSAGKVEPTGGFCVSETAVGELGGVVDDARMAVTMTDRTPRGSKGPPAPNIEEARLRQQAIGVKLRHMFDQVVNEPVPDEFLEILRRADHKSDGKD